MKLKCIGSKCDENYVIVDDNMKLGDVCQARIKSEFKVLDYIPAMDQIPEIVAEKIELYVLCLVVCDGTNIKYLRPMKWTEEQALRFALT